MISIIIPVYNGQKYLPKCLDSVLTQVYKEIEVILIDDFSEDKSLKIAKSYRKKYLEAGIPYKIINHDKNKGAPAARNHGFQVAKGEYVLFCDADAVLEKNILASMLTALYSNEKASFAYSSFYWGKKLFKLCRFSYKKLRKMPYIHTISLLRSKDFPITGWDENIKKLQDWDLWLTICEKGGIGIWVDKPLFKIHPGGTISSWLPKIAYKLFPFLSTVKKYNEAIKIIKEKHHIG